MEQPAQFPLGVPSIKTLLDFVGGFLSLAPFLCMGIDREDYNLQIFPTMIFSFSICSLHLFPFLYGCYVNTLYKPAIRRELRTIGKCFISNIEAEKIAIIRYLEYNSSNVWNGEGEKINNVETLIFFMYRSILLL